MYARELGTLLFGVILFLGIGYVGLGIVAEIDSKLRKNKTKKDPKEKPL